MDDFFVLSVWFIGTPLVLFVRYLQCRDRSGLMPGKKSVSISHWGRYNSTQAGDLRFAQVRLPNPCSPVTTNCGGGSKRKLKGIFETPRGVK